MKITFIAKNGLCPYFIHKNIKYYIQDKKVNNEWIYYLCSIDLLKTEKMEFDNHELALNYVRNIKNIGYSDYTVERNNWVSRYGRLSKCVFCRNMREESKW